MGSNILGINGAMFYTSAYGRGLNTLIIFNICYHIGIIRTYWYSIHGSIIHFIPFSSFDKYPILHCVLQYLLYKY